MLPTNLADIRERLQNSGGLYDEFVRVDSLSVGLYRLAAGMTDPQQPHNEDEIYYVVSGRARVQIGDDEYPARPGDVILVGKHVSHRFVDIQEDLELLVFFAPAETQSGADS